MQGVAGTQKIGTAAVVQNLQRAKFQPTDEYVWKFSLQYWTSNRVTKILPWSLLHKILWGESYKYIDLGLDQELDQIGSKTILGRLLCSN